MQFYPAVKKLGVKLMRGVESFQNRHSLVSTDPVLANAEFPWVDQVEAAYPAIRAELDALLEHPERIPARNIEKLNQLGSEQLRRDWLALFRD